MSSIGPSTNTMGKYLQAARRLNGKMRGNVVFAALADATMVCRESKDSDSGLIFAFHGTSPAVQELRVGGLRRDAEGTISDDKKFHGENVAIRYLGDRNDLQVTNETEAYIKYFLHRMLESCKATESKSDDNNAFQRGLEAAKKYVEDRMEKPKYHGFDLWNELRGKPSKIDKVNAGLILFKCLLLARYPEYRSMSTGTTIEELVQVELKSGWYSEATKKKLLLALEDGELGKIYGSVKSLKVAGNIVANVAARALKILG